jgi:electron transfer flavoprotein beta subunit
MHIVVCVKQVPDTSDVKINPETNTLIREGVASIINPFDENAIEAALEIKDKNPDTKVTVLSMGPPQVAEMLKVCIAMGVDDAILLSDRNFAGADTLATSYSLAQAIKKLGDVDLIICGKQAIDGDTAQVGPGIAEYLDINHITYVAGMEYEGGNTIKVKANIDGGYMNVETGFPALLTVLKTMNEPRYPSLKGKMMAKKKEIPVWDAKEIAADFERIGLKGSPTVVVKIFTPQSRGGGEYIDGETAEDKAKGLVSRLKEMSIL